MHLQLFHQVSLAFVAAPLTITLLPESVQPSAQQNQQINPASSAHIPTPPQCLIHYASGKHFVLIYVNVAFIYFCRKTSAVALGRE